MSVNSDLTGDSMESLRPEVSIVIPTRDSGRTIGACLASIFGQCNLIDLEVIVVDDTATRDSTREIVGSYGASLIISSAGMAESRNVGIQAARAKTILSLDSDMVLEPGLLERAVLLSAAGSRAATIAEKAIGEGYWARCKAIDKLAVERVGIRSLRLFEKALWKEVGGYDESLEAGEDLDFDLRCRQTKALVAHISDPCILHDE